MTQEQTSNFWTAQPPNPSHQLMSVFRDSQTGAVWVHAPAPSLRAYVMARAGRLDYVVVDDPSFFDMEWAHDVKVVCPAAVRGSIEGRGCYVYGTCEQLWGSDAADERQEAKPSSTLACHMCAKQRPRTEFPPHQRRPHVRRNCTSCEKEINEIALANWTKGARKTAVSNEPVKQEQNSDDGWTRPATDAKPFVEPLHPDVAAAINWGDPATTVSLDDNVDERQQTIDQWASAMRGRLSPKKTSAERTPNLVTKQRPARPPSLPETPLTSWVAGPSSFDHGTAEAPEQTAPPAKYSGANYFDSDFHNVAAEQPSPAPQVEHETLECSECGQERWRQDYSARQRRMGERRRCLECTRDFELSGLPQNTGPDSQPKEKGVDFEVPLFKTWKNPGEELISGPKVTAETRIRHYVAANVLNRTGNSSGWSDAGPYLEGELQWSDDEEESGLPSPHVQNAAVAYYPATRAAPAYFVLRMSETARVLVTRAANLPDEVLERMGGTVKVVVHAGGVTEL